MPIIYLAFSHVYYDIDPKEDYKLEEFSNTIKEILESIRKDNEYERWGIDTITNPIINIFSDSREKICLALNFGIRNWFNKDLQNEAKDKYILKFNGEIGDNIKPLIEDLYGGYMKILGMCTDHSYVQYYQRESNWLTFIKGPAPHDDYKWMEINTKGEMRIIGKYALFNMFPKEKITLPSRQSSTMTRTN